MSKSKLPSTASLLVKLTLAWRRPAADGSNVIPMSVVLPAVTGDAGASVTSKSAASAPPIVTSPKVRSALPSLSTVKVRVRVPPVSATMPKSVWSAASGVTSPSAIDTALPRTSMEGRTSMSATSAGVSARL